jgi:hypothetical protein
MLCCGQLPKFIYTYINEQSVTFGWGRGRKTIADVNKSVVKHYGSHSTVMFIVSWCILMKAFEKSGMISVVLQLLIVLKIIFHVK